MILGQRVVNTASDSSEAGSASDRIQTARLGVTTVNATMKWDDRSNAITSKAAKRLGFLKKLKRAGVHKQDLLYFFLTVI